ncbi:hypothetical protein B7P43_G08806 [Cryptotermes secundus]|uniref:Uncharacterized protein n=1 Tax=Cryptotermes secundus TaxID=105785 RepID=A0A2J7PSB3_9NEOP|nr:hypothetical protein B7P43_G08806 [Cryptotermes secundus]
MSYNLTTWLSQSSQYGCRQCGGKLVFRMRTCTLVRIPDDITGCKSGSVSIKKKK